MQKYILASLKIINDTTCYLYPQFEFYGLNNTVSCATISTHLEGVNIEHYFDIENNPCLESQARIYLHQTLCDILVNC